MFEKQLQLLEQTVNQLTALLDEETNSILTHQMDKVIAIRPRKKEISDLLGQTVPIITASNEWKQLSTDKTDHLKKMVTNIRQKLDENKKALDIAETSQEKVVTAIRDAVKIHQGPSTSYSEKGKVGEAQTSDMALVLNEKI